MTKFLSFEPALIIRFFLFLPLLYFINFPFEYNADYVNYYPNFTQSLFAYEPAFEWYSILAREVFGLNFFWFWMSLTVAEVFLFSLIYRSCLVIGLSYFSIIGMSQFFYGTQIRYAIVALVLTYSFFYISRNRAKITLVALASLIHYGGVILSLIGFLASHINPGLLLLNKFRNFIYFFLTFIVVFIVLENLNSILPFTRFSYYINSGEYVSRISIALFSYLMFSLFFLALVYSSYSNIRSIELRVGLVLLFLACSVSPIAALSGRLSLFYFVIEPLIVSRLLMGKVSIFVKSIMLATFFSRCVFYIVSSTFYFY